MNVHSEGSVGWDAGGEGVGEGVRVGGGVVGGGARVGREGGGEEGQGRGRRPVRCGTAMVEFAVCLPVIFLLAFGAIEASSFIYLKQSLHVAAYEGARSAIRIGSDNARATESAGNILASRKVRDFRIAFPKGESRVAKRGEEIVIEVSAPTNTNSPLVGRFVTNRMLTSRVVMVKE